MSIEVFIDECSNNHELYETNDKGYKVLGAVATVLGVCLNSIGVSQITNKNHEKVFLRLEMLALAQGGGPFVKDGKNYHLTLEHVQRHIGLRVNTCEQTAKQFAANLLFILTEKASHELVRQLKRQVLIAQGYLFTWNVKRAVEKARQWAVADGIASKFNDPRITLGDIEMIVNGWTPDQWTAAFKPQGISLAGVAEVRQEVRKLTDAWALDTPMNRLEMLHDQLHARTKEELTP